MTTNWNSIARLVMQNAGTIGKAYSMLPSSKTLAVDVTSEGVSQRLLDSPSVSKPPSCIGEIRGQEHAKTALLIAATGPHSILMEGPPGEGKSAIASTMPGFMPLPTAEELADIEAVYAASGVILPRNASGQVIRPFRAVGPTVTPASLIGGGRSQPVPGEFALAHAGILFLDEIPQFGRRLLDLMRQPLQDGHINILRNGNSFKFPSRVVLVAAMNPCPCGWFGVQIAGSSINRCTCSSQKVLDYRSNISGPILDRIDLRVKLSPISNEQRFSPGKIDQSKYFLSKVLSARCLALRYRGILNCDLNLSHIGNTEFHSVDPSNGYRLFATGGLPFRSSVMFTESGLRYFTMETDKSGYSTRRIIRLARVARTIADLHGSLGLEPQHIQQAMSYVSE